MPPDSTASTKPTTPASPAPLLERTLGPDWRCFTDAEIRVGDDSGPVDLIAIHPRHGVVLVALLRKGETASADEAAAAFRAMLDELGMAAQFPGEIKVAAIGHEMGRRDRLAEAIREAAGDAPESPPPPGWADWLGETLSRPAPAELRLVATPEAEAPPLAMPRLDGPRERPAPPSTPTSSWTRSTVVAAALAGLALAATAVLVHAGLLTSLLHA